MLAQTLAHLHQGQIGLGLDPVADHVLHWRQSGDALAALLPAAALAFFFEAITHPIYSHAADFITTGNGAGSLSALQRSQYSISQVLRIGSHLMRRLPEKTYYVTFLVEVALKAAYI